MSHGAAALSLVNVCPWSAKRWGWGAAGDLAGVVGLGAANQGPCMQAARRGGLCLKSDGEFRHRRFEGRGLIMGEGSRDFFVMTTLGKM